MSRPASPDRASRQAGFTMLELIMAMTIFSILGAAIVVLMRQGLTIFATATRDTALQDRMDTVLPQVERHLQILALPANFDPPPPPPTEEERLEGVEWVPPPPVWVRVRAGWVVLRDVSEGPLKDRRCTYVAWVTDISGIRSDPILRRAGSATGPEPKYVVPAEVDGASEMTLFRPTGGLREVCFIAVPEDPEYPALLTLYFGSRSPVGGPESLLEMKNFDTLREVKERCRPIARGLLHFDAVWRRVFATSWDETPSGSVGETNPYVGRVWDSTRAIDKKFALHRGPDSLGDPSDDVFPAWVRLEVALVAPSVFGFGRGETMLMESMNDDTRYLVVEDVTALLGRGPSERFLNVDGEWMRYQPAKVDLGARKVPVDRGQRGTLARSHTTGAQVYVGLASRRDVRLLYRDRYARGSGGGR